MVPLYIVATFVFGALLLMPRKSRASEPLDYIAVNSEKRDSNIISDTRPRGIRNNNPGNIEDVGIPWVGLTGNDGRYCIFDSPINGIRAMIIDIRTGFSSDKEDTVAEIIREWAPANENDTAAYIRSVCDRLGVEPNDFLNYQQHIMPLCIAITWHENGQQPYPKSYFESAYRAAS